MFILHLCHDKFYILYGVTECKINEMKRNADRQFSPV
jgi:hypothetical protein